MHSEPSKEEFSGLYLVPLDADHPGFRDGAYRARRDAIARIAEDYRAPGPVPEAPYSEGEQHVWRAVWERLDPAHRQHACAQVQRLQDELGLGRGPIPQLAEMNRAIEPLTGFRLEPVAGLVESRRFLEALGRGVFLSTQYIRHASRPLYTPEPDIVHEAVGHAATLTCPVLAEINRSFGRAASQASPAELSRLDRAYWFTMEFGMVEEDGACKAFGAGLLSSAGELEFEGRHTEPLDLDRASRTDYDPTDFQPLLFVAPSYGALTGDLAAWLDCGHWRDR